MMRLLLTICLFLVLLPCIFASPFLKCPPNQVPVTGFAQSFILNSKIKNAKITILETGGVIQTDKNARFQFCAIPHSRITFLLRKKSILPWNNYKTTQSGTFVVTKAGFVGEHNNISFQVPTMTTYHLLKVIITKERKIELDPSKCNVVTTITAFGKTLKDDPQGEPNAKVILRYDGKPVRLQNKPFYFGIIAGKTSPFTPKRGSTSLDGGVLIYNLTPRQKPYTISARKPGVKFNSKQFICRAGAFINLSPPQGPTVQR